MGVIHDAILDEFVYISIKTIHLRYMLTWHKTYTFNIYNYEVYESTQFGILTHTTIYFFIWILHVLYFSAIGTDAHSCDPGQNNNRNPCHEAFLPNGVLLLEFVANLDRMPITGSTVFFAPMKMRDGSGGPCRILAIYGEDKDDVSGAVSMTRSTFAIVLMVFVAFFNLHV